MSNVGLRPIPIDSGTHKKHPTPMNRVGPVTSTLINHSGIRYKHIINLVYCNEVRHLLRVGSLAGCPEA